MRFADFTFAESTAGKLSLSASSLEIDFDITVVGQALLFSVLMIALHQLLFKPMLQLFEERENQTEGAKSLAHALDERTAKLKAQYEQAWQAAREQAYQQQTKLQKESLKEKEEILSQARQAALDTLEQARDDATKHLEVVQGELQAHAQVWGQTIADRLLNPEVRS